LVSFKLQDEILQSVFDLCLYHGFIIAWDEPNANFECAYALLLDDFKLRLEKLLCTDNYESTESSLHGKLERLASLPVQPSVVLN
jgi:hypothetical protein